MTPSSVAIVTGGAGGLGTVIGRALARDGHVVVLADRDLPTAAETARRLQDETGGTFHALAVDITDSAAIDTFVEQTVDRTGRLDVLVNCAGVEVSRSLATTKPADWDLTMAVNVRGPMLLSRAALPFWTRQGGGAVVNIASRAHIGGSKNPAYSASKAALVGLTLEMAVELGPIGVRVNAVSPSFVRTPFNAQRRDVTDLEAMIQRYEAFTPLRRLIDPEDVANTVAFLASDRARGITGEVIHVTAGSHLPPMA